MEEVGMTVVEIANPVSLEALEAMIGTVSGDINNITQQIVACNETLLRVTTLIEVIALVVIVGITWTLIKGAHKGGAWRG